MPDGCLGNCLVCGKCGDFPILDGFAGGGRSFEPREGFGLAVDIGTTSVVLAALDLQTGRVLRRHSFLNPQRAFGPDVITRIGASIGGQGAALRSAVAGGVAAGVDALLSACRISPERVAETVVAGNTAMVYLLLGLPCESLGAFPFQPAHALAERYAYAEVFGAPGPDGPLVILPWLAAFVGGDITAGLLHVRPENRERFLLVDLGTNGEMALYHHGRLTVTSTAAGPAFEGGRQGGGASGVIGKLAALVRAGHIEESGLLSPHAPNLFTQKDIRDLQLAKSAVRTGMEILLDGAGPENDGPDAVYLAGGIGQAMDVDDAVDVGLLPRALKGRVRAVGNASLGGAARRLRAPARASADLERLLSGVTEINLAAHPRFNDLFMEYMCF